MKTNQFLDVKSWKSDDILEWLSHLMYKGEPICLLYEENFVSKDMDGGKLLCSGIKDFLDMDIPEEHAFFINSEKKKLVETSSKNHQKFDIFSKKILNLIKQDLE